MDTVLDVVTGALELLGVRTAESPIEPVDAEDGLTSLNDMMAEFAVDGIDIGYEELDDTSDELRIIAGHIGGVKANLAVYIAPNYSRVVTQELALRARDSKRTMRMSIPLNGSKFPDTLPIGSGNEGNNFVSNGDKAGGLQSSKFYPSNARGKCS